MNYIPFFSLNDGTRNCRGIFKHHLLDQAFLTFSEKTARFFQTGDTSTEAVQ
jgi:hypothetical protein